MCRNTGLLALTSLIFIALGASAFAVRTYTQVDVPPALSPKKAWQKCHDTVATKLTAARHWEVADLPKGFRHIVLPAEQQAQPHEDILGSTEGLACSWEEVFRGVDVCVTNWNQLNKTLSPANDVSRAAVNLDAKGYVCGLNDEQNSCFAIDHCRWNDEWSWCHVSNFFVTLQYACHASPVRDVSICIDYSESSCKADERCTWHSFDSDASQDVCLPIDVPTSWTAQQVDDWLMETFHDESKYWANWGDCLTSHTWLKLMACGKHKSEDGCGQDALCVWVSPIARCTLKPDKFLEVYWGGDLKTVNTVTARGAYCHKFGAENSCVRAMPDWSAESL